MKPSANTESTASYHWGVGLSACPQRSELRQPLFLSALATYGERSGDRGLIERLLASLDHPVQTRAIVATA